MKQLVPAQSILIKQNNVCLSEFDYNKDEY